jgi:hypothetical protein
MHTLLVEPDKLPSQQSRSRFDHIWLRAVMILMLGAVMGWVALLGFGLVVLIF